jgi:hypothetical protein
VLVRGPSQPIKRRSIEKPRPLRSDPDFVCLGEILKLSEEVEFGLRNYEARNDIRTRIKVQQLKELLRLKGSIVERNRKEVLDVLDITMREACRDVHLDIITRLNLLEILELRLNNWEVDPAIAALYRQKIAEAQLDIDMKKIGFSGEVDTTEAYTTKNPGGDNLLNMMVTTTSTINNNNNTVCPAGDAIKQMVQQPPKMHLVEAGSGRSVMVEAGSGRSVMVDPCNGLMDPPDHCASLVISGNRILISSNNKDLVKTSKDVLQEYFSVINEEKPRDSFTQLPKPGICYEKDELMRLSKSPLCKKTPFNWDKIIGDLPFIAKKPEASSKHFLREMEGIRRQEATTVPLRKM